MAESISQLERDIKTLTSEVHSLEIEISSKPQPRTVCHPCGPRWLTLSPYKRVNGFFEDWEENTEEFKPVLPTKMERKEQEYDIMSESQISSLDLDASAEQERKDANFDMLDHANCRILGALRCYCFNLEMGTLVTGDKVHEGVKKSLEELLEISAGVWDDPKALNNMESAGGTDEGDLSDEQRLVGIVEEYLQLVLTNRVKPTQDIIDMATRILDWTTNFRATNDEEEQRRALGWSHWWRWM